MDIRESIKQLAKGQGSYGRLDARLDAQNFKDIVDLVMYLEG